MGVMCCGGGEVVPHTTLPRVSGRDRTVKRIQHKSTYFSNSTKRKNVYTNENPHIKLPIFGRSLKMSNFYEIVTDWSPLLE